MQIKLPVFTPPRRTILAGSAASLHAPPNSMFQLILMMRPPKLAVRRRFAEFALNLSAIAPLAQDQQGGEALPLNGNRIHGCSSITRSHC